MEDLEELQVMFSEQPAQWPRASRKLLDLYDDLETAKYHAAQAREEIDAILWRCSMVG